MPVFGSGASLLRKRDSRIDRITGMITTTPKTSIVGDSSRAASRP